MSALLLGLALQLKSVQPVDSEAFLRRVTPTVQVVQAARPAVVYIQTNVPSVVGYDIFGRELRQNRLSSGSGVVIYEEGYIVTNFHVVRGANEIRVQFDTAVDETSYPAQLINWNEQEDLAVLKIDREDPFPTVPMGTSADLMIGEDVIAIGNPYGQTLSVSRGIISGLHRDVRASGLAFSNLIQTDASINPGNSGGPLLNVNGELIGINTVMNMQAENIGFAIPVDQVSHVLQEHLLEPSNARGWLGFEVDLDRLTVSEVTPGGPADAQGIEVGDRVIALDGKDVGSAEEYKLARLAIRPGGEAAVRVRRDAGDRTHNMRAWDRIDVVTFLRAGIIVEPVVIQAARAVRVRGVRPGGPADELGIRPDDVIEAVQPVGRRAQRIGSPDELALLLTRLQPRSEVRVDLWRDDDGNGVFDLHQGGRSEAYKGYLKIQ
jgi:serine protease Do